MDSPTMIVDAEEYIIAYIAYLDKTLRNFVVVFYNVSDKTLPVVRSLVKRKSEVVTAVISTTDSLIKIAPLAEARFRNESIQTVLSLYRTGWEGNEKNG